ncbi:hypothetical protein JQ633_30835 [Bradyrhizobium tropiciagri]|uniref:hypothetical protein n=1 Tax=Bradyrhizobium tropiciagri TaxID=312253 RepID=UPI001BA4E84A|nr:hypothetical protein [Bradyrhizobium tropiciagri]MBR0874788.1 hypothetical protein [Bradyrhizobium tropiciagri]
MTLKSGRNRLRLVAILLAAIGVAAGAEAQPQSAPTDQPTIRDVRVRPRNEQTDVAAPPVPYVGKSLPASDVKHVHTTHESSTPQPVTPPAPRVERQWATPDAKWVRTTREHATGEPVPALQTLRPPADRQ